MPDETKTLTVDGREIEIGNPAKTLFPETGLTKTDLAEYYARAAEHLLPHLRGRPVSMQRFPDGIEEGGFYQKRVPDHFPDWISRARVEVKGEDDEQEQVVVDDAATLVYLADQAVVTPHPWLSRSDRLDRPDRMVFDLDPPDDDFEPVSRAARLLRDELEDRGLKAYVTTTGSRGLHVVVPIRREQGFDTVRAYAREVAEALTERHPDKLTTAPRKAARAGRLFLDTLRNAYGQTAVPAYGVRAREGAPVATPLDWDELSRSDLHSTTYHVKNVFRRLSQREDPWADLSRHARSLPS